MTSLILDIKKCSACKLMKPLSSFAKDRSRKDSIQRTCRDCYGVYSKKYRAVNGEDLRIKAKRYDLEHDKERREYRVNTKEHRQKRSKQYYTDHNEVIRARSKRYYELHQDEQKLKRKQYRLRNLDKQNARQRMRNRTDILYRISGNLRKRIGKIVSGQYKSGSAVRDLGCTLKEFFLYIESLFLSGMTWENYGCDGWHIDHIRPLCSFDLTDPQQIKLACHYTNLRPLWAIDNFKKSSKDRRLARSRSK